MPSSRRASEPGSRTYESGVVGLHRARALILPARAALLFASRIGIPAGVILMATLLVLWALAFATSAYATGFWLRSRRAAAAPEPRTGRRIGCLSAASCSSLHCWCRWSAEYLLCSRCWGTWWGCGRSLAPDQKHRRGSTFVGTQDDRARDSGTGWAARRKHPCTPLVLAFHLISHRQTPAKLSLLGRWRQCSAASIFQSS